MNTIRIVIADDHRILRQGLRSLIETEADMEVVAEANNGIEALDAVEAAQPDVLILDIAMPKMSGIVLLQRLYSLRTSVRVLVLSAYADASYLRQVLATGATGFVVKRSASEELLKAIRTIVAGGTYLDPSVAGQVAAGFAERNRSHVARDLGELTDREREVLQEVARGYSNKEIAGRLDISVKTVETHKTNFQDKLGMYSRAEVVRYAIQQGWLTAE